MQSPAIPLENWVLCRVFLKRRGIKNEEENVQSSNENILRKPRISRPMFYDFMTKDRANLNLAPCSSSSGSSGITEEVPCHDSDDHEENSSCDSFPFLRRKQ